MVDSDCCREKLTQYKIERQSKPFIDKNLQLQLPGCDSHQAQTVSTHSPIYSHYLGSSPFPSLSLPINEDELYHVMAEAEHSYEAWKQMQQQLKEAVKPS